MVEAKILLPLALATLALSPTLRPAPAATPFPARSPPPLIDALTFWTAGYRHVTSSYGAGGFTDELLEAIVSHGVKRVLIAYDRDAAGDKGAAAVAEALAARGVAVPGLRSSLILRP